MKSPDSYEGTRKTKHSPHFQQQRCHWRTETKRPLSWLDVCLLFFPKIIWFMSWWGGFRENMVGVTDCRSRIFRRNNGHVLILYCLLLRPCCKEQNSTRRYSIINVKLSNWINEYVNKYFTPLHYLKVSNFNDFFGTNHIYFVNPLPYHTPYHTTILLICPYVCGCGLDSNHAQTLV